MEGKAIPTKAELTKILALLGYPQITEEAISAFVSEEDGYEYAVWLIDSGGEKYVLKRAKAYETEVYRCFFKERRPYVPAFIGSAKYGEETYFLTEYCQGEDLRICKREKLRKVIEALTAMQDEFWQREDLYGSAVTMERALEGIENRGKYLGSELLEKVYGEFKRVYRETPRTLCHDDLLPINVLVGDRAVFIDWEYGGILPYLSSVARLIAHGREEKGAFFYMTGEDRNYAIDSYFEELVRKHGISYDEYRRTLEYFMFYEYCEWVMIGNRYDSRSDERYRYYLKLAEETAEKLS